MTNVSRKGNAMVLIDMDMPENCIKCPLHDGESGGCQGNSNIGSGEGIYDRPRLCPIKTEIFGKKDTYKICPKCKGLVAYNPYFKKYICNDCGKES